MTLIHLASHTELIHKWFLKKIHEMRIFETKKIVGIPHVFPATRWGFLKSPFVTSIEMKWNEIIMNLYSAKTIEEYSKALYIKLKLMNK